jgi:hypothetical protein
MRREHMRRMSRDFVLQYQLCFDPSIFQTFRMLKAPIL